MKLPVECREGIRKERSKTMGNKFSQQLSRLYHSNKLPWILICAGILLRLNRYLHNPSLWFDESRSALLIIPLSISKLFPPGTNHTFTYPAGYLMLENFATEVFGYSEYALRFFPLLFSIVSLFVFYKVAKQYIRPGALPVALGLFVILDPLIHFSSELKPYAGDAAIALLLYAVTAYARSRKFSTTAVLLLGGLGAITVWFSHPAVIVLTGLVTTLGVSYMVRKEWTGLKGLFIACLIWGISFLAVYLMFIQPIMYNSSLANDTNVWIKFKAFMPLPPMSLADIQWFLDLPLRIFSYPLGLTFTGIATLAFIAGCISLYSENKERFFMLISPLIITMLASSFHKYVFSTAPILFLMPLLVLFIAEGTHHIREKLSQNSRILGTILAGLLFIHPLATSSYHAIKPSSREEIKPVLTHIKNNWQEGDILYVYYMSQFAFEYYSRYHPGDYHFNRDDYVIGRGPRDWYATYKREEFNGFWDPEKPFSQPYTSVFNEYVDELNTLKGHKRVWILFSSSVPKSGINEEKFFVYHLETIGTQIDFYGSPGVSSVYLYDLSSTTSKIGMSRQG